MTFRFYKYDLKLKHPFTIARNTRTTSPSVIVEFEHENIIGYGEAAPSTRYGETQETVCKFLADINLKNFIGPFELDKILSYVDSITEGNTAAKAAVDIALHDWIGKSENISLWRKWNLDTQRIPVSSFTIGLDSPDVIEAKIHEAETFPILKVKLGRQNDREIMTRIRSITNKTIRVDANEGWKNKEEALENILWLESMNVELIEQPLPASKIDEMKWLWQRVHIPMIADESVVRGNDIPKIVGAFDGINIKLMKSTGLLEARKMIDSARKHKLKIMLGCMIETSIAISAASQLLPLADYADLDGNILISNDPFSGAVSDNGIIQLKENFGIGVDKRLEYSS
ncbi:MAG: dipeptide epimerase [Ignavibacteriales bacterium]|nr:dipeptide epimerase [Ignavibacteriales bacterium]